MGARAAIGEDRFLDVSQDQVERDPVGTAERIYRFAGIDLGDDVKVAMGEWAATNRRGSRGAHQYSAEEFGLSLDDVYGEFADYCRRFTSYVSPASVS
jgi:hypothetical protein